MALPSQYLGTGYFSAIPSHPDDDHHLRAIHADPRKDNGRKRPKYTRSKLGCLTCRIKKVKCGQEKPDCTRCIRGQRECTWPEVAPPRRKPNARSKQGSEERPSTAGSDGRSDSSSSPLTREQSTRSTATELSLNLDSRGDPLLQVSSSASAPAGIKRLSAPMGSYYSPSHQWTPSSDSPLHSILELQHPYNQQNNNSLVHPNHHRHIPPPPSFFSNSSIGSYSHVSSVYRAHEPTLPPLDMSRFPPPLSMHCHSSSMPLDSDSYVRHPNINDRVYSPHGTMSSASQQSGKNSQILHPVSVW